MTNAILLITMLASSSPTRAVDARSQRVFASILADAKKSAVTPKRICAIQHTIKLSKTPAWDLRKCEEMAADYNRAKELGVPPILPLALTINESDLDEQRSSKPKYKTYPFYFHGKKPLKVQDHGLMGVRCVEDKGICINGHAKGLTPKELKSPSINIRVGLSILLQKKKDAKSSHFWDAKWLLHYNGNTSGHNNGYAERIFAITAAINGIQVKVDSPRMEKLTDQIISAVKIVDRLTLAVR